MAVVDLKLVHQVLLELAEEQLGLLEPEAVARASDEPWKTSRYTIDPHLLVPALHQLVHQGRLGRTTEVMRGGRPIPIYHPFDLSGRQRAVETRDRRNRNLTTGSLEVVQAILHSGTSIAGEQLFVSSRS